MIEELRKDRILLPTAFMIDRLCTEALARGTRAFYRYLADGLDAGHRDRLDRLLAPPRDDTRTMVLTPAPQGWAPSAVEGSAERMCQVQQPFP